MEDERLRLFELETDENAVYFTFINSNPPTFGYKRALDTLREVSKDSEHVVFINPAYNGETYPLPFDKTLEFNKKIFTDVNFSTDKNVQNPIQALKKLSEKYTKIYFLTRDKNIKDYSRMYQYAENWGVESFEIIGLGDSSRPLPTGTTKENSIDAVLDDDYESFKKTIPTSNNRLTSELFLEIKKEMLDDTKEDKEKVEESYLQLLCVAKYSTNYLNETIEYDDMNNRVYALENIMDTFKNLKLVFGAKFKGVSLGKDKNKNYVLMMNTNKDKLQQFLELNEGSVKKALEVYLKESITSGVIASTANMIGGMQKRDIDYSFIKDIKKSKSLNKRLDAVNYVLNNYGYINKDVVDEIESRIE